MKITILMAQQCSAVSVSACMEFLECANFLHQFAAMQLSKQLGKQVGNKAIGENIAPLFQLETASIDGKPVMCTGGLVLTPQKSINEVKKTDLIIVPGFMFNIMRVLPLLSELSPWLQQHHSKNTCIASMCTGAFVTAQAGLLNNKAATTHWFFSEHFQNSFPQAKLQIERTVTDDGLTMCSGGASASIDLLMHIIRKYTSPQLAAECAKKLLTDAGDRDQTPYMSTSFKKSHQDGVILKIQLHLEQHLHQSINMEEVVGQFGIGMRNFIRRFKDATDQTPIQYLQNLRIEKAKYLLESSKESFERITEAVGYEDGNSFRRLFKERVGLSPSGYRKKFLIG